MVSHIGWNWQFTLLGIATNKLEGNVVDKFGQQIAFETLSAIVNQIVAYESEEGSNVFTELSSA